MKYRFIPSIQGLLILGMLVALSLLLAACAGDGDGGPGPGGTLAPTAEPTPTAVTTFEGEAVVYVVAPLSGEDAQKGQALGAGARFAAEELNRVGGVLGNKVLVKVINDRGDPEGALDAAQRVAGAARAGEKVIGLVIHEASDPQLESVSQVYLDPGSGLNVLVVVPASTELVPAGISDQRFFRLSASSISQASEVAHVLREGGLPDVVVVHSSTPEGKTLADEFRKAAMNLDVDVLATIEILPPDAGSYAGLVDQVRELNPSALFFAAGEDEAAVFLSDLFGFEFQASVYGSNQALSYTVVDELGCQAEGLQFASLLPDPSVALTSQQLSKYAALEGRAAEPYTVAGYSAVEFMVRAFEKAGSLDAQGAGMEAHRTKIATILGELAFDDGGNPVNPKIHFFQVQGRQFSESFARAVGSPPKETQAGAAGKTTMLNVQFESDKEPVSFAGLNWDSAQFANSIARIIIESGYGHPTYSVYGSTIPLFQSLRKGDVQVYMEGWLPNLQELYDKAITDGVIEDVGLFFGNAIQGWFVPKYVIEGDPTREIVPIAPDLRAVNDLKRYSSVFASEGQPGIGRLIDGSSGWASYKIDCMKLKAYRLDDRYAQITSGSEAALFAALSSAYENGEPILTYLYEPSWPIARFDLVQITEPDFNQEAWNRNKGVEFPLAQIKKLVHPDLTRQAPELVEFLGNISMTSEQISDILQTMKDLGLTPEEYASIWLKENETTWSGWVPPGVATQVKQALEE